MYSDSPRYLLMVMPMRWHRYIGVWIFGSIFSEVDRKTDNRPVLYGGGVTPVNAQDIWSLSGIAGIMLGQGCLDATAFAELVNRL